MPMQISILEFDKDGHENLQNHLLMAGVQIRVDYTMCRSSGITKCFGARQSPYTFSNIGICRGSDIVQKFGDQRRSGIISTGGAHRGSAILLTVGPPRLSDFGQKLGTHKRSHLPLKKMAMRGQFELWLSPGNKAAHFLNWCSAWHALKLLFTIAVWECLNTAYT